MKKNRLLNIHTGTRRQWNNVFIMPEEIIFYRKLSSQPNQHEGRIQSSSNIPSFQNFHLSHSFYWETTQKRFSTQKLTKKDVGSREQGIQHKKGKGSCRMVVVHQTQRATNPNWNRRPRSSRRWLFAEKMRARERGCREQTAYLIHMNNLREHLPCYQAL